jgi:hypothetical protein
MNERGARTPRGRKVFTRRKSFAPRPRLANAAASLLINKSRGDEPETFPRLIRGGKGILLWREFCFGGARLRVSANKQCNLLMAC